MMKENLNTILLSLILLGVGINTYVLFNGDDTREKSFETAGLHGPNDGHDHSASMAQPTPANTITPTPIENTGPATTIAFAENSHDFGTINQDTKNSHVFKFTNTGSEPLIIQNAQGSCGCTVPQYPREPIAPGGTGEIIVEYSPGKQEGTQNKTVTITANTNPPQTLLDVKATVVKAQ